MRKRIKRLLLCLFAGIMLFALTACGGKTVAIEITADNWDQYFELLEGQEIHRNAFGELESVYFPVVIALKPEYQERFVNEGTDAAFKLSCTTECCPLYINKETGEYRLGDRLEEYTKEEEMILERLQNYTDTVQGIERSYDGRIAVVTGNVSISFPMESGSEPVAPENFTFAEFPCIHKNCRITEAKGSLVLLEK